MKQEGDIKRIVKDGSLYIFGNIFNKAIAFITVPIFTRLLTTEEYGIVNMYSAWVTLLAVFIGLSMGQTIRSAYVDMSEELGKYISSMFTLAGINTGMILLVYISLSNNIELEKPLVVLCLIESFSNFVVNSLLMKYVMEEEAIKRTLLMVLPNLIGVILSIVMISVLGDNKHYGRIIGTCLSMSFFGVVIVIYYFVKYHSFININIYKYALPLSIPLIFHGIACNILGTSDRTLITYYRGAAETGIYSLIYNLSMVANVVVSSAESIWIPKMTKSMINKDIKETNYGIKIYMYVVTFAFCGLLTIAPEMVWILGGEKYMSGTKMIFPIVAASYAMFLYGIYVNAEYFYKKTKMIAVSTFVAAGVNFILNIIFIPHYGSIAAAYTTLISYLISMFLHWKSARMINDSYAPFKNNLGFIMAFIIVAFVSVVFNDLILMRYIVNGILGIVYVVIGVKFIFRSIGN